MPVVVYKTEYRCKICKSGHRDEIDEILEKRATGQSRPDGVRINVDVAIEMVAALGVQITEDNIKSHWKSDPTKAHSYYEHTQADATAAAKGKKIVDRIDPDELKGRRAIIEKVLPGWQSDPWPLTPDQVAQVTQAVGMYDALQKFLAGDKSGITVDHALKGGTLATQRKVNDAAAELLEWVGIGVSQSVRAALSAGTNPVLKQLGPVDHELVVEGETTDGESRSSRA